MDDLLLTEEYQEAVYWAELSSPVKGKRAIDELVAKIQKHRLDRPELEKKIDRILNELEAMVFSITGPIEFTSAIMMLILHEETKAKSKLLALYPDEAEIRQKEREKVSQELGRISCIEDCNDRDKAITSLIYALKEEK